MTRCVRFASSGGCFILNLDEADRWLSDIEAAARRGDWGAARRWADRALALGLEHPRILHIRAAARERDGDAAGVLADLSRANALTPGDPGVANALGIALIQARRWAEAVTVIRPVAEATPDLVASWMTLGAAEMGAGRMYDAEQAYRRAAELDPDNANALAKLAVLAIHRGASAEAHPLAERALALEPANSEARRALIESLIDAKRPEDAEREARAWLAAPGLGPNARTHGFGLLGDALDAEGRYPEAFRAYAESKGVFAAANRAAFGILETRPLAATLKAVEREFDALDPGVWRSPEASPAAGQPARHVFLMGFMRSGTTLLEQALAQHPEVVTIEELETLADSGAAEIGEPGGLGRIADFGTAEIEAGRAAYWRAVADAGVDPARKVLIDKLPFNGIKLPLIAKLFPEAKVIFAIRDPRDVVLSCFQKRLPPNAFSFEMRTLEGAARFYAAYMALVSAYRASLPTPILEHVHERLIDDVERSVGEVCQFVGLDFRPEMVAFEQAARAGRVMSQSSRQLGEGLTSKGAGRWRRYAEQMAPALPILAPWVAKYGYPLA